METRLKLVLIWRVCQVAGRPPQLVVLAGRTASRSRFPGRAVCDSDGIMKNRMSFCCPAGGLWEDVEQLQRLICSSNWPPCCHTDDGTPWQMVAHQSGVLSSCTCGWGQLWLWRACTTSLVTARSTKRWPSGSQSCVFFWF